MKYIAYALAALIGFHLRWIVSACNSWSYSMNGIDIIMAVTCIIMVWAFKGLLPQKKKETTEIESDEPEKDEALAYECHIRAISIVNVLVGGKLKALMAESQYKADAIRTAVSFQEQYLYLHPELLEDDCENVSLYTMALLNRAGVLDVYKKA